MPGRRSTQRFKLLEDHSIRPPVSERALRSTPRLAAQRLEPLLLPNCGRLERLRSQPLGCSTPFLSSSPPFYPPAHPLIIPPSALSSLFVCTLPPPPPPPLHPLFFSPDCPSLLLLLPQDPFLPPLLLSFLLLLTIPPFYLQSQPRLYLVYDGARSCFPASYS